LILQADDEGRLRGDPVTLAETVFSPLRHGVTEEAVIEALDFWQERDWLVRYGDDCVFLCGWFEHQYINKERRESSSLPAAPCAINSWAIADAIFAWHAGRDGASKTHYRTALRAFLQQTEAEQEEFLKRTCSENVRVNPEGKGSRKGSRKGKEGKTPPPDSAGMHRADGPMLLQNNPILANTLRDLYPMWSQAKQSDFVADAASALAEPGCRMTEDDAVEDLNGDGKPEPDERGDWWIGRRCKERRASAKSKPRPLMPKSTPAEKHRAEEEVLRVRAAAKAEEDRKREEANGGD
jgi:hypothetical protein